MKLQFCSDLHLEFSENRKWLKANPLIPQGEVLLIAGDTYYLNRSYHKLDFIKWVADEFEQVILIPGNHEYYEGFDVSTALGPVEESIMENVILLNNTTLDLGRYQLVCSTLWSSVSPNNQALYQGLVDFRRIRFGEQPLSIEHFNQLHTYAFSFLSEALKNDRKKVVVTHHLPSHLCNVEEFKGSPLNEGFCAELTDFVQASNSDYWIYGHSHRNKTAFRIGNTKMMTNQLGYVRYGEEHGFDRAKVVDLQ
jgi:predicted phosphohydrolase